MIAIMISIIIIVNSLLALWIGFNFKKEINRINNSMRTWLDSVNTDLLDWKANIDGRILSMEKTVDGLVKDPETYKAKKHTSRKKINGKD